MDKKLALISGVFICIFIFLNGEIAIKFGLLMSTFIFHGTAFLLLILSEYIKNKKINLKFNVPLRYLTPGLLSVIIVTLNSLCIKNIGLSLVIGISMFGQLVFSNIVDHYGLMEMPIRKFTINKFCGMGIILLGIFIMIKF